VCESGIVVGLFATGNVTKVILERPSVTRDGPFSVRFHVSASIQRPLFDAVNGRIDPSCSSRPRGNTGLPRMVLIYVFTSRSRRGLLVPTPTGPSSLYP
jgi:hypothetical protein